ncbi:hypothetical protein [Pacificimonas flava]|uniref:Uncharacterized protein n=1 Tax=Pacificimonas flava TaxID=1234595 RepID=M2U389_9SPHN|nr:hypothetical protein [Pacificimonas flava]EMD82477.1 hypothetical protein C725_2198 [Pacificimonas flava]MBB5281309.1 hypothetical protein [Pacificimonas flava]
MGFYLKTPDAAIDYAVDWGAGYLDGQSVADSDWRVDPAEPGGLIVETASTLPSRTAVILSGGRPGRVYRVTNRVTLSDGRTDARGLSIRIDER